MYSFEIISIKPEKVYKTSRMFLSHNSNRHLVQCAKLEVMVKVSCK